MEKLFLPNSITTKKTGETSNWKQALDDPSKRWSNLEKPGLNPTRQ